MTDPAPKTIYTIGYGNITAHQVTRETADLYVCGRRHIAKRHAFDTLPEACNEALAVAHRSVSNAEKRLAAVRAYCDELLRKSAVTR